MRFAPVFVFVGLALIAPAPAAAAVDVDTYHGDNLRSGWNAAESTLTTANVKARSFGRLFSARLDGLSFMQPLIAAGEAIPSLGTHDLVIAGTNKDLLYAYDANDGAPIWKRSFVDPRAGVTTVPVSYTGGCNATGDQDGLLATPVIDRSSDTLFVVAATLEGAAGSQHIHHRLHALALATGLDKMTPVDIAGSFNGPGGTLTFDGDVQFQRPALLEANGNVYVGFGSQCDFYANVYHGWVFAYTTTALTAAGVLNVTPTMDQNGNYFGGIWMSGYGLSSDASGSVYFAVGNGTFDGLNNFGESVLRLPPNLSLSGSSYFAPYTAYSDNAYDADLGSGGLMLLPDQPGSIPHMAVAQGKDGILTLLNRDDLGGFVPGGPDNVLAEISLGGVWSGPAYWQNAAGNAYVFTTGEPLYSVEVGPHSLTTVSQTSVYFPSPNGNGSTPSVSSLGTTAGTAVVWLVQRPANISADKMYLYAFDASNLHRQLYRGSLGFWSGSALNPTPVPTIANGKVYVTTAKALIAFGLNGAPEDAGADVAAPGARFGPHVVYALVRALRGSELTVQTRTGKALQVDIAAARRMGRTGVLYPGRSVALYGDFDGRRRYHVNAVVSAAGLKFGSSAWPADR